MAVENGVNVRMGELAVASNGHLFTLLGSCVAIIIYNRRQKLGGLAHAVLPASRGEGHAPGKFVDTAIEELVAKVRNGDQRSAVTAKLAGGADMFSSGSDTTIGAQNVDAAELHLEKMGIRIAGRHIGGQRGRRLTFEVATGKVFIQQV